MAHDHLIADARFKSLNDVDKEDFHKLVAILFPPEDPGPGHKFNRCVISPQVRLAIPLRTLAGAKLLDLGWPHTVGWSSCYTVVVNTLDKICRYVDDIHFPTTPDERPKAANGSNRCVILLYRASLSLWMDLRWLSGGHRRKKLMPRSSSTI